MRVGALAAAFCLALAAHAAAAAEGRKFAVLSLVGDRMLIVNHLGDTGTRVDQNRRDFVDMPPRVLDNAVVQALERSIKAAAPGDEVVMLGASPALYAAQGEAIEDPDVKPVVDMVKTALGDAGITHLVLVSKLRHEAMLRFANGNVGSGRLEGLGFYVDHAARTRTGDGRTGRGFLAPFGYFRVSLVDMARGESLGYRDVVTSLAVSQGRSESLQAWEALSAEEKVKLLNALTRREAGQAVKSLLEAR